MPFASTLGTGMCSAFPDVCKTPTPAGPVPIPYPNIAQLAMANPGTCSLTVLIFNKPAATTQTTIMLSSGDEAGCAGGVVSGVFIGPAKFVLGSTVVMIGGAPAVYLGSTIGQNGVGSANMPAGQQVVPSQGIVTVAP
ncbi:DUF4150 domain-containing protein [Acidisphaera sp. L21]|uniref:DUF4150 domain-containing protein n=1 Tax=Acidisphaera sp. L21 TaxID=1641851 RepID=UPI00131DB68B